METMNRVVFTFVDCLGEIWIWLEFFKIFFVIIRVYTKKFTLLRISPVIININIWVAANSLISIHFAKNPAIGGNPAKFAIIRSNVHFSFLVFGVVLIFFCFEFFMNRITNNTEVQ